MNATDRPIAVVLGPFSGGTSCVAGVLAHLGVYMGDDYQYTGEYARFTYEAYDLARLCQDAFSQPEGRLKVPRQQLLLKLQQWAECHRASAPAHAAQVGGKHPLLCLAVPELCDAWQPVKLIRVTRPLNKVLLSLQRRKWWRGRDFAPDIARLISTRDQALQSRRHLTVDYDRLIEQTQMVVDEIIEYLTLAPDPAARRAACKFVEPGLRRIV